VIIVISSMVLGIWDMYEELAAPYMYFVYRIYKMLRVLGVLRM
jgi:hypothetical protein